MKKNLLFIFAALILSCTFTNAVYAADPALATHTDELGKFTCQSLPQWDKMVITGEETSDGKKSYKYAVYSDREKKRLYPVVITATDGTGDPLYEKMSQAFKASADNPTLQEFKEDEITALIKAGNDIMEAGVYIPNQTKQNFVVVISSTEKELSLSAVIFIDGFKYTLFAPLGREYTEEESKQINTNFFKIIDTFKKI